MGKYLVMVAPIALAFVGAAGLRAECPGPPGELAWSFPADGDVDVPINSHIFVLPTAVAVRLDGVAITAVDEAQWDPGPLATATVHVVDVDVVEPFGETITTTRFTFTTGDAVAPLPAGVEVTATGPGVSSCGVENDGDCADDFPCFRMALATAARDVVLWHSPARGTEWLTTPCDEGPSFEFCTDDGGSFCGSVTAFGADGTSVTSNEACATVTGCALFGGSACEPTDDDVDEGEGDGPAAAGCASGGASLPVVLPGVLWWRRRRRAVSRG